MSSIEISETFRILQDSVDDTISMLLERSPDQIFAVQTGILDLCKYLTSSWTCASQRGRLEEQYSAVDHTDESSSGSELHNPEVVDVQDHVIDGSDSRSIVEQPTLDYDPNHENSERAIHRATKQGTKRASERANPDEEYTSRSTKKRKPSARTRELIPSAMHHSPPRADTLTELSTLAPSASCQLTEVRDKFMSCLQTDKESSVCLLLRAFYAIGSPHSLRQLRDACRFLREKRGLIVLQEGNDVANSIRVLDSLDITACAASILRRYHLVQLVNYRDSRQSYHQGQMTKSSTRTFKYGLVKQRSIRANEGSGRAASLALQDLFQQGYPHLQQDPTAMPDSEQQRAYASLKRRLNSGRNWNMLVQKFSIGILALIPVAGTYGLHNHELESLPKDCFQALVDVLYQCRGGFLTRMSDILTEHVYDILLQKESGHRFQFEHQEDSQLGNLMFDSVSLIAACSSAQA